jgi:hypothetical protein
MNSVSPHPTKLAEYIFKQNGILDPQAKLEMKIPNSGIKGMSMHAAPKRPHTPTTLYPEE